MVVSYAIELLFLRNFLSNIFSKLISLKPICISLLFEDLNEKKIKIFPSYYSQHSAKPIQQLKRIWKILVFFQIYIYFSLPAQIYQTRNNSEKKMLFIVFQIESFNAFILLNELHFIGSNEKKLDRFTSNPPPITSR